MKKSELQKLIREEIKKVLKESDSTTDTSNTIVISSLKKLTEISRTFQSMGVGIQYEKIIDQLVSKMMKDFNISYTQIKQYTGK